jgi:multidrug resistance efflux pump
MQRPQIGQGNWIYLAALLGIAALGAGAYYAFREYQKPAPQLAQSTGVAAAADPTTASYPGKIRALKTLPVPAPIDGALEEVSVADGEEVYEGQLLARITNSTLEAAKQKSAEDLESLKAKLEGFESQLVAARLESSRASADLARARAEYEAAAKNFERQKLLFREGAGAKKNYDTAGAAFEKVAAERAQLESAVKAADSRAAALQTSVEEARAKLNEATTESEETEAEILTGEVKAPVSGLIVNHKKNAGDQVTRDIADLFEIAVDLSALEVVVEVPKALEAKLAAGQNALVQIAEAGPAPLEAKIREVKDGQAYVEFLSPSPAILPAMTAQVRFLLPQ